MSAKTHHSAPANGKDVIYIDVDDEITAIIDKLQASPQKIVALVLPKRASAFQSVVNMKLLKRSADHSKKNVVLITSDPNLMPLAGGVGLHVAKSLQSKPEVPDTPEKGDDKAEEAIEEPDEPNLDKSKSLAELNGDDEETIELDDEDDTKPDDNKKSGGKKSLVGSIKKFKIPDFNKFRMWLFLGGGGLIVLIVLGFLAFGVMPKAKVVITTDNMSFDISQDVHLKTGDGVAVDVAQAIVPAKKQEVKKTIEATNPATGQQNNGEKASGQITLSLNDCAKDQVTVPAGTGVSAGGKTFITKTSAKLESVKVGNQCQNSNFPNYSTKTVQVTAQTGGAANNIGPSTFTVAGYSNVSGQSSAAMSGGTDSIEKILSQADIDAAKQKLTTQDAEAVKSELEQALSSQGYSPIVGTFAQTIATTKQSADPGAKVEEVTVTEEVVYSMLGVKNSDFEALVAEQAKAQINAAKQSVTDYGLNDAIFTLLKIEPDGATIGFQTTVVTGAELNEDEIKQQVAGKKANEAEELIKAHPGVTSVDVTYSPFWVSAIPKKTAKITVVIEESQTQDDDSSNTSQ